MPVTVSVKYSKGVELSKDPAATYADVADVARSIPRDFPGLASFTPEGKDTFRWTFRKLEYAGQTVQLKLVTRFDFSPPEHVHLAPVSAPDTTAGKFQGEWRFEKAGSGTRLVFDVTLEVELPLPGLMKAIAQPLAQKEMSNFFDRYLANVAKALSV